MGTPEHAPPRLGLAVPPTLRGPRRCRGHALGRSAPGEAAASEPAQGAGHRPAPSAAPAGGARCRSPLGTRAA